MDLEDVRANTRSDIILDAVVRAFENGGYDAVSLRGIAKDAHVSLTTIYDLFPSREALCVAAMHRWVAQQYKDAPPELVLGASRADRVMAIVEHLLDPFLKQPTMLDALSRLNQGDASGVLMDQAVIESMESWQALSGDADDQVTMTEQLMVYHLLCSLVIHYAGGAMPLERIVPYLRRFVRRLMDGPFDRPRA
jgi:AcrR family transcriptional regulator